MLSQSVGVLFAVSAECPDRVLPLLASDAVDLFEAVAHRRLAGHEPAFHDGACACVVLASAAER